MLAAANTHNDILPNLVAADIEAVCNIEKHYAYLLFANHTYILIYAFFLDAINTTCTSY